MSTAIREVATVTVSKSVSGLRPTRGPDKRARMKLTKHIVPSKELMDEAKGALREGEYLDIVSDTVIYTRNRPSR